MDELYHYGIKGMKWGVRRAEKREIKNQQRRDKYMSKTATKAKNAQRNANIANENLKSLKKHGLHHEEVTERAIKTARDKANQYYDTRDQRTGNTTDYHVRDSYAKLDYKINKNTYKQQAYDSLVSENKADREYYTNLAKNGKLLTKQL